MITIDEHYALKLKKRENPSHKMTYGRCQLIAGSENMMGAAILSAQSAYRTGAGLIKVLATPEQRLPLFIAVPEAVITPYHYYDLDNALFSHCDTVLIGPGLGYDKHTLYLLEMCLAHHNTPIVLDADALNVLADHPEMLKSLKNAIITPHIGEMSRLTGLKSHTLLEQPETIAANYAKEHGITVVLKSHRTVIATEKNLYINHLGNPGMATAGSGDVLAGIITALLGQGYDLDTAAHYGVAIHSKAGDHAAMNLGTYSLMASDLIHALPAVLKHY